MHSSDCHVRLIARRYGDEVDEEKCGHCEVCLHGTEQTNQFLCDLSTVEKRDFDEKRWDKICKESSLKRTPIVIARFAAGISSPFITKNKYKQLATFGSMADTPFEMLLERSTELCE
eukprot:IDg16215t1